MMNHKLFKKMVNWLGLVLLAHIISMLVYGFFMTNIVSQMYLDGFAIRANLLVLVYSVAVDVMFVALFANAETSYTEYRKELKESIRSGEFSIKARLRAGLLKESLIKAGIYFVLQIPYAVYYSILGYNPNYTLKLAQFYGMDSAFYMITNVPILGMLLRALQFAAVNVVVTLCFVLKAKKDIEENMVERT